MPDEITNQRSAIYDTIKGMIKAKGNQYISNEENAYIDICYDFSYGRILSTEARDGLCDVLVGIAYEGE